MQSRTLSLIVVLLAIGTGVQAQTVTTTGGTTNYLAKFSDSTVIASSVAYENGKLGIDNIIGEAFRATASGANAVAIRTLNSGNTSYFGTEGSTAGGYFTGSLPYSTVIYSPGAPIQNIVNNVPRLTILTSGNVGIGTTTPQYLLDVTGTGRISSGNTARGSGELWLQRGTADLDAAGISIGPYGETSDWFVGTQYDGGGGTAGNFAIARTDQNHDGNGTLISPPLFTIVPSGNVGIGTTSPSQRLEVAGDAKVVGMRFATDGSYQTTAWTGVLCGGDYAESVKVSKERSLYEPGDVLEIDGDQPGSFVKSSTPYSTAVVGVYSTKPGVIGRRSTDSQAAKTEIPMAMVGIVPIKVSAENGPIRPKDLLVTSSIPGYAMKGTDSSRMTGAIVGKSLGSLDSGTGVIEAIISLQ